MARKAPRLGFSRHFPLSLCNYFALWMPNKILFDAKYNPLQVNELVIVILVGDEKTE
jgi:hypothetical protein